MKSRSKVSSKWLRRIGIVIVGLPVTIIALCFYLSAQSFLSVKVVDSTAPNLNFDAEVTARFANGASAREPFPERLVPQIASLRTLLSIHDLHIEAYGYETVDVPMPKWGIEVSIFSGHGGVFNLRFTRRAEVSMRRLPLATDRELPDLLKMLEARNPYRVNALHRLHQSGLRPKEAIPALRDAFYHANDCIEYRLARELLKELEGEEEVTKEVRELTNARPGWINECLRTRYPRTR